jgi:3-oxoacyl-[acyl-carrier protein] reductase
MRIFMSNKIAVITGASRGIGRAITLKYAQMGYDVAICCHHNKERLEETAKEVRSMQVRCLTYVGNIGNYNDACTFFHEIETKLGSIDILINNAGITNDSTLKKMTVEQWQNVIDVNLSGTFYCCKAVLNYMLEAGYGRIVNASSVVGLYGNFGQTNYVATKAGLIGMTKTMARELGRKGITVNAVAPGFIETEMVAKMPENVLDGMRAKVPVGRLGRPEEIAAAYLYLASDEAAYVNGAVLSVDGGMTV